ncbi:lysophospholipid acyltransferase family protein [Afifella sp. IM 167]|uniref:lysophospholipid acyltransferase family protein n=1 Tax=Afifella sp. IM 167 TaxID=2033586 RepID=UPI001CC935DF|nr:lysophospholipid acyltransferase family protein [Afifella sp. IM 167]MBZ8134404.1 1-acyl-sn-glycerol-3-phosphate acyltransferase [Afifella sp. IM 167]
MIEGLAAMLIVLLARLATGVRAEWRGTGPERRRRIYFANHVSNGDFVLLWAVLPPAIRQTTRPVAAADYWLSSPVRRFIAERVFRAVLISRSPRPDEPHPVEMMADALAGGASLILFPEGTRNTGEARLLPFKSGIFRLVSKLPEVECVPVWIDNLNRVLPKGEVVPVPLLCTVTFGEPLTLGEGEEKEAFLARARAALMAAAPDGGDRDGEADGNGA